MKDEKDWHCFILHPSAFILSSTRLGFILHPSAFILSSTSFILSATAFLLLLIGVSASAQTLPLDGYFRPGNYMPVSIHGLPPPVTLVADGAVMTEIHTQEKLAAFLPILASATEIRVKNVTLPLRAMKDNERLVGFALVDPKKTLQLFPGKAVIPVALDPSNPVPEPVYAWDSLDAIAISSDGYANLKPAVIEELLACNVTIAVQSIRAPDTTFPWMQEGDFWLLRADFPGPTGAEMGEQFYLPLANFTPYRSGAARWMLVALALCFSLVVLMVCLLPRRFRAPAVATVSLISAGVIAFLSILPLHNSWILQGDLLIERGPLTAFDTYIYYAATRKVRFYTSEIPDPVYPMPISEKHMSDVKLLSEQGRFVLAPGQRMAFRTRNIGAPRALLNDAEKWNIDSLKPLYRDPPKK